ncbi:MAG: hypothetical protein HFF65_04295 [Oscillospiraceae bacterium]|jgi:hypothetical protein|nr:hypothetical protein [Oscillospiraceae bacterium]
MKLQQKIAENRCGTTVPGAKTKQKITRKDNLGRIGKDEVPSSNLGSSSKIPLKSLDSGGISFVSTTFGAGLFLRFFVDPHRDPHAEMFGKGQRVPDRKFRFSAWLFCRFFCLT